MRSDVWSLERVASEQRAISKRSGSLDKLDLLAERGVLTPAERHDREQLHLLQLLKDILEGHNNETI